MSSGPSSRRVASRVARFTVAPATPGTVARIFSTRATQAAQLMPSTGTRRDGSDACAFTAVTFQEESRYPAPSHDGRVKQTPFVFTPDRSLTRGIPAVRLYSFTVTPNNRKVEAFVRHFDLPVEVHHVSFKDRETQSPEYLAINPMGKVPALVDGDFRLWESNAILTYLATLFPETGALPADPRGRADVDRWLHWQSCHLMPAMGALKVAEEKDVGTIAPLLAILDRQLAGREYLLGTLSVADFAIAVYLMTKLGRQLDYGPVPHVAAWLDRMGALRGFVATQVKGPPAAA